MTRSTRGVVDDNPVWGFRKVDSIEYVDPETPVVRETDYVTVFPGFPIYRDGGATYDRVVFWGVGIVSFGPVTDAQSQFIANLTASSEVSDFPGDYIAVGFSEMQWTALGYGKKSSADYVYFASYSDTEASGGGFASVIITPDEITLAGSASDGLEVGAGIGNYQVAGAQTIFLADLNQVAGTSGSDNITGSDAPEAIDGSGGADHLIGGAGSDRLTGGGGKDHLEGGVGNDRITGDAGQDQLFGGEGNDRLEGGLGNDLLAPGTGTDFVDGGAGDDRLQLDLLNAQGSLTIGFASSGSIRAPGIGTVDYSNMETVDIQGGGFIDVLAGGAGDDRLYGNGSYDILSGGDGNDVLDGGGFGGALAGDLPAGGESLQTALQVAPYFTTTANGEIANSTQIPHVTASMNLQTSYEASAEQYLAITVAAGATVAIDLDIYGAGNYYQLDKSVEIFDNDSDGTLLLSASGDELDAEGANLTYTFSEGGTYYLKLWGHIYSGPFRADETLKFHVSLSSAVPLDGDRLAGGAGNDTLMAAEGNDFLDGGIGIDLMTGGAGNDTYVVDNIRDRVLENSDSQGGNDLVLSSISYKLGLNVESLTLTGAMDISGTGNNSANTIVGNSGANTINGGAGQDVLIGGDGADSFLFSSALGSSNHDDILDFSVSDDTIVLSRSFFTKVGATGALASSAFFTGSAAADAADRIVYDQTTGNLYYDRDGSGAAAQVLFAHVEAGTLLTNLDFLIA